MAKKPSIMDALRAVGSGKAAPPTATATAEETTTDEASTDDAVATSAPPKATARRPRSSPRGRGAQAVGGSNNPGRAGRVNVTGYFDPAVKQSLRLIQAKFPERRTEQDLLAEALDDLFAKYGVPQTARAV